eukprot:GEMP01041411.1.p1 GENE.GEMP01041411.1~~GEMP01041411.1.p1  ORF type:complete len:272 (+),score=23.97 GEMP01041411.1:109-924(+)
MQTALNHDGSDVAFSKLKHLGIGLLAGSIQSVVFHPYDRALFLCQIHDRPFFVKQNWPVDLKGLNVGLIQRSITYGLFFPLEAFYCEQLGKSGLTGAALPLIGGQLAGATNGALTNSLAMVKYLKWNHTTTKTASEIILGIYATSGKKGLTRGLPATLLRDSIFGGSFTFLRTRREEPSMLKDGFAALVATVLCSPLNYARNMQYADFHGHTSLVSSLRSLHGKVLLEQGTVARIYRLAYTLRIGYGTFRVAVGMSFGGSMYRYLNEKFSS